MCVIDIGITESKGPSYEAAEQGLEPLPEKEGKTNSFSQILGVYANYIFNACSHGSRPHDSLNFSDESSKVKK